MKIPGPYTEQVAEFTNEMLSAKDFDGTISLTSDEGKGILTVNQSYAAALDTMFGPQIAERFLIDGHNSETPAEIIMRLHPDMDGAEAEAHAIELINGKIAILSAQIGTPLEGGDLWPRPTEGFLDLWKAIENHNLVSESQITPVVLSAGHVPFITKVFELYGLEPPMIVTDDLLVSDYGFADFSPAERAKPNTPLIEVAHTLWLGRLGIEATPENVELTKANITYAGDDLKKDGGLAANYGVEKFKLIEKQRSRQQWRELADWLGIGTKAAAMYGGGS